MIKTTPFFMQDKSPASCGAELPVNNRYSICDSCLRSDDDEGWDGGWEHEWMEWEEYDEG